MSNFGMKNVYTASVPQSAEIRALKEMLDKEIRRRKEHEQELYNFILEKFTEYNIMKENAAALAEHINSSDAKNTTQTGQINDLMGKVNDLIAQNAILVEQVNAHEGRIDAHEGRIDALMKTIDENKAESQQQENNNENEEDDSEVISLYKPKIVETDDEITFDTSTVFCKTEDTIKITLPTPTEDDMGNTFMFVNMLNGTVKIVTQNGVKIGGQHERTLKSKCSSVQLITDGANYFVV